MDNQNVECVFHMRMRKRLLIVSAKFDNSTALSATSRGAVLNYISFGRQYIVVMLINMEVWYGTKKRTASMVSLIIIMVEAWYLLITYYRI